MAAHIGTPEANDQMHSLVALVPVCLARIDAHDTQIGALSALTDTRLAALEALVKQAIATADGQLSTALTAHHSLHLAHDDAHDGEHRRDKEALARAEALAIERLAIALSGHTQLHAASDLAHAERHAGEREALHRAESTLTHTAELHANSHEREHALTKEALAKADTAHAREHMLAQEALAKADAADTVRFEHLNEAKARAADERVTFATKEALDDKHTAMADRMVTVERYTATAAERVAVVNTSVARINALETDLTTYRERMNQMIGNSARLDALERNMAATSGRDHGIGMSWQLLITAVGLTAVIVGLLARIF